MELKQVVLTDAEGVATYAQPEVFDGVLVLALQHESGRTERLPIDSPRVKRLTDANADLKAALEDAKTQAQESGVKTSVEPAQDNIDALVAALKRAGLVVTPSQPAAAEPAAPTPIPAG